MTELAPPQAPDEVLVLTRALTDPTVAPAIEAAFGEPLRQRAVETAREWQRTVIHDSFATAPYTAELPAEVAEPVASIPRPRTSPEAATGALDMAATGSFDRLDDTLSDARPESSLDQGMVEAAMESVLDAKPGETPVFGKTELTVALTAVGMVAAHGVDANEAQAARAVLAEQRIGRLTRWLGSYIVRHAEARPRRAAAAGLLIRLA